ncbi:2-isopropylmalate synthase [Thermogladius sp. KZ2Tp1]|uniref:homocitrate synthase/isopropylmalate synthase family protein n=1 Tax=Thermogladius sp. KZ2Tp1 TaxID=3136289 RepID=UPI003DAA3124
MDRLFRDVFPFSEPPKIKVVNWAKADLSKIYLTDTTLRDGQQGWKYLTVEEGLEIYELLHEIGGKGSIRSTEVFLYTGRDRALAKAIMEKGYEYPKPVAWIRANLQDLNLVSETGLDEAVVLMSISDYHILYKFNSTRDVVIGKYISVAEEAFQRGITVKASLEDVTRADLDNVVITFLQKLINLSEKYGVKLKVKLPDTLGVGMPFEFVPPPRGIPALVTRIREETNLREEDIEFHGHNDLGLVVANHLAAWFYGAASSNVTLLGIGERAGNCPLEVMAIHYAGIKGLSDINLRPLGRIRELFEKMGYRVPDHLPILGKNAFKTKAGIHADGLLKNPEVYLPFDPYNLLGIPVGVEITPHSGRAAVAFWLKQMLGEDSISKDSQAIQQIFEEIVQLFEKTGRTQPLTDEEMLEIASKYYPQLRKKR